MATYDSAWCLERFNQLTGRPTTDDSITDDEKYTRLSEAQQQVVRDIAPIAPWVLAPKVPYTLFPAPFGNAQSIGTGTLTLSGGSYAAGDAITATASENNFTVDSVGLYLSATDPTTRIPILYQIASYVGADEVTITAEVDTPLTMVGVAMVGWGIGTSTATDGQVFTFGFDTLGHAIYPLGKAEIFPTLASWPDFPWVEGYDYINEGTQIRLPNNRTWNGALYWYGIVQPSDITASVQPVIVPEGARELIVYRAASMFAEEAANNTTLADRLEARYQAAWTKWAVAWRTQWQSGNQMAGFSGLRFTLGGGNLGGQYYNR